MSSYLTRPVLVLPNDWIARLENATPPLKALGKAILRLSSLQLGSLVSPSPPASTVVPINFESPSAALSFSLTKWSIKFGSPKTLASVTQFIFTMNRLRELSEEFRRSLKTHHEEEFGNTTIEDMRKEIHDIQLLRDRTNNMMDMNRLRMFLDGMEELDKVLLHLEFPGTKGVMSIVWASVRFLLRVFIGLWFMHGIQLNSHRLPTLLTGPSTECSMFTDSLEPSLWP